VPFTGRRGTADGSSLLYGTTFSPMAACRGNAVHLPSALNATMRPYEEIGFGNNSQFNPVLNSRLGRPVLEVEERGQIEGTKRPSRNQAT
jgi:hypothetical protein